LKLVTNELDHAYFGVACHRKTSACYAYLCTEFEDSSFHHSINMKEDVKCKKTGIEIVQALDDIFRSALCCHSNETRTPMGNAPSTAQLEGTLYRSANLHTGPCSSVGMRLGTDRHRRP